MLDTSPTLPDACAAKQVQILWTFSMQKKNSLNISIEKLKYDYPPVNKHSNGNPASWIGNTSSNVGFYIAMLDYRSVRLIYPASWLFPFMLDQRFDFCRTPSSCGQQPAFRPLPFWLVHIFSYGLQAPNLRLYYTMSPDQGPFLACICRYQNQ